jgi:hypothetical protein
VVAEALDVEATRRACERSGIEDRDRTHVHMGIASLEGKE